MSEYFLIPLDDLYRGRNGRVGQPWRRRHHFRLSPFGQLACLDDQVFGVGQQLARLQDDIGSTLVKFGLGGESDSRVTFPNWADSLCSSLAQTEGQDGKLTMNIPLGENIEPEDLKVSVKDRVMTIEAKKEHVSEDGDSRVYQEFFKKFTLPPNVDMKEVKSTLTPEGYLKIEAPLPQPQPETGKKLEAAQRQAMPIPIHQG